MYSPPRLSKFARTSKSKQRKISSRLSSRLASLLLPRSPGSIIILFTCADAWICDSNYLIAISQDLHLYSFSQPTALLLRLWFQIFELFPILTTFIIYFDFCPKCFFCLAWKSMKKTLANCYALYKNTFIMLLKKIEREREANNKLCVSLIRIH